MGLDMVFFGSMHLKQYQQCVNSLIAPCGKAASSSKSLKFKPFNAIARSLASA